MVDLGSCYGSFCLKMKKEHPNLEIVGYEFSFIRAFISRIRSILMRRQVKFFNQNLHKANLLGVRIVNIYLPQEILSDVLKSIKKNMQGPLLIFTNRVNFEELTPKEVFDFQLRNDNKDKVFVYEL